MGKKLKDLMLERDLLTLTVALVLAFAIFSFLETLARALIAPIFAALFAEPGLDFMSFTINYSRFNYGSLISATLVLLLTLVVISLLAPAARRAGRGG